MTKKRPSQINSNPGLLNPPLRLEDHLNEIRTRLLYVALVFLISSVIGFIFRERLFEILVHPLNGPLFYTTPAGGFNFVITLSIRFGLLVAIPFAIYHLALFIAPAQPQGMKFPVTPIVGVSFLLLCLGILFAYYISIPTALAFLKRFGPGNISSIITAESYLLFISVFILGFGLLFQLPLVMFLINKIVHLRVKNLLRAQKWVVLAAFVLAAILTPTPDIANQVMMAIPMIVLYQISVLTIYLANRRY